MGRRSLNHCYSKKNWNSLPYGLKVFVLVEKRKEALGESASNKHRKRRLDMEEERLKANNRDLSSVRMKSMFAIGFCFTALLGTLNSM